MLQEIETPDYQIVPGGLSESIDKTPLNDEVFIIFQSITEIRLCNGTLIGKLIDDETSIFKIEDLNTIEIFDLTFNDQIQLRKPLWLHTDILDQFQTGQNYQWRYGYEDKKYLPVRISNNKEIITTQFDQIKKAYQEYVLSQINQQKNYAENEIKSLQADIFQLTDLIKNLEFVQVDNLLKTLL